jgi:hypothetical protein
MFFSKNDLRIYFTANREQLGNAVVVNRHGSKLKIVDK